MIQLQILSGSKAGVWWTARHFPVRLGRAAENDLAFAEAGVWDRHATIEFDATGFTLRVAPDALATVNHQPVRVHLLRPGDAVEIGSVRLRFWLAAPTRCSLGWPEAVVWALLVGIFGVEIWLLLRLLT
jgi:Inner membrane component of T3SS, cytoplasmic domain